QNMDEWLKSHFMMILPLNFIAPAHNGDLRKAAKDNKLLHQVIAAVDEGHQVLEKLGYTVTPASQLKLARKQRKMFYIILKIMLSTPVGKILLGDKAVSADEMSALYQDFIDLKSRAGIPTPNCDTLGIHSPLLQS
ncbi:2-dehydropantoate 2-reductase, partial [Paenibacillus riograndensis]